MIRRLPVAVALALLTSACARQERRSDEPPPPDSAPTVVLETSMGRIVMRLDRDKAPRTVDNIVRHLGVRFYDGLTFHRVVPGFIIQTGQSTPDGMDRTTSAPFVPIEADNGLRNTRGTVALARMNAPNTGGVQFYVNLKDNPELDHRSRTPAGWGYTVFGRVTEGMDVVDRIGRVPTGTVMGRPETPLEPVILQRAFIQRADSTAAPPAQ